MVPVLNGVRRKNHDIGPGSYSPGSITKPRNPSYSFRPRTTLISTRSTNPGPGTYDATSATVTTKEDPQTVFGSEKRRKDLTIETAPGPGSYEMRLKVVAGK